MKPPFVLSSSEMSDAGWYHIHLAEGQPRSGLRTCFRSHSDTRPAALRDVVSVEPVATAGPRGTPPTSPNIPARSPSSSFAIRARAHDRAVRERPDLAPPASGVPTPTPTRSGRSVSGRSRSTSSTGRPGELVAHAGDAVRGHAVQEAVSTPTRSRRAGRPTCPARRAARTRCRARRTRPSSRRPRRRAGPGR